MTGDPRPLLALGAPEMGGRTLQPNRNMPRLSRPGASRQGERLSPQFRELVEAFDAQRVAMSDGAVDEVDPELVLVFDLAGSVEAFRNAINNIEGLEFLSEFMDEASEPDDDFHMSADGARTDRAVQHSLYLVLSNTAAVGQLVSLFDRWQANPGLKFERGLGRFKAAFAQLRAIRRWSAIDRVRETGLLETWQERLEVVGQSVSVVSVEIELWYRRQADQRQAADDHLTGLVEAAGGSVVTRSQIGEIAYHALLAEIPVQQVEAVLRDGAEAIDLLNAEEIMFVSPYTPMTIAPPDSEPTVDAALAPVERVPGLPRVALLDGLPFANHDALAGRLVIDDPDNLGPTYPLAARHHGTAMASLILHGDLSTPAEPAERPLYVRPVLQPHPVLVGHEVVLEGELLTDLLRRAVRRIVEGEAGSRPAAPSVRIVNLSIGAEGRALVRRISPLGRLLDWLAVTYNLLFVVSAGNHLGIPITIPAGAASDRDSARREAVSAVRATSRLRGILPPGDSLNAITVGAAHADRAETDDLPDDVWDVVPPGTPAFYSALGPGVGRSVKPDIFHPGGRQLYQRPVVAAGASTVELRPAVTSARGPGVQVAIPRSGGATNATAFTQGTSNSAASITREASAAFDVLERGRDVDDDFDFPNALLHPVLAKALLVHTGEWGDAQDRLKQLLGLPEDSYRRDLTPLLGYGGVRPERIARAATNRAVMIAGNAIGRDQRHTYSVPLPASLRSKAEWHRFSVTLAYFAPTAGQLTRYRSAKVFFDNLGSGNTGGRRIEADHNAVRRGSVQHEIFDGERALAFRDGDSLSIDVQCMDDGQRLPAGDRIRYGLVVSIETAVTTSTTIHDEVRAQLQARARTQVRPRVQP